MDQYPTAAVKKWAWRCAETVELLDSDYSTMSFIASIRAGKPEGRGKARSKIAHTFYFAWQTEQGNINAAYAASNAADILALKLNNNQHLYLEYQKLFNCYIDWLIEELYEYECRTIA